MKTQMTPPTPQINPILQVPTGKYHPALHTECKQVYEFYGNKLDVSLSTNRYSALLDSGSDLDIISQNVFDKLPDSIKHSFKPFKHKCTVANGKSSYTNGTVVIPVSISGQKYRVEFTIFPDAIMDVILGIPFFQNNRACLDFSNNQLSLLTCTPVHTIGNVTIPPQEEIICPARIMYPIPPNTIGECTAFRSINDKGILIANAAVRVIESSIPVRLFNYTKVAKTLKPNVRIATFMPYTDQVELIKYPGQDATHSSHVMNVTENDTNPDRTLPNINMVVDENPPTVNEGAKVPYKPSDDIDWSKTIATPEQKEQLKDLINEYQDCFVGGDNKKLGLTPLMTHKIEVYPGSTPVKRYPYRMSPHMRTEMDKIIQEQLDLGVIEESKGSEYASPALLVRKANNSFRMVIDFRELNLITVPRIL